MSSRHDKDYPFETDLPEHAASVPDAQTLHELQRATQMVLQLATQTHAAVARSDAAGARAARMSLKKQLMLTTRMIDELVFGDTDQPTKH